VSDDGRNTVIRPMIYCAEETLAAFAAARGYPILPCNLCGSQETAQRKRVKALLNTLEAEHAGVKSSVFAALGNVRPTQLLDRALAPKLEDLAKPARRASLGDGRLRVLGEE
jgi:tRNA 2-thiocytidine biosynthesis protein TtcA